MENADPNALALLLLVTSLAVITVCLALASSRRR
jgi:hypothetical protein